VLLVRGRTHEEESEGVDSRRTGNNWRIKNHPLNYSVNPTSTN
jgi:hypothetical protein